MTDDPVLGRRHRRRDTADERLVEAARLGDQAAFTALVRRHDDQMRALAWSVLHDRTAMDDVLQDAYLKAYRNLDRFRGDSRFSTWLYRIVYRTCLDHVRRRREVVSLTDDADLPATGRSQGDVDEHLALQQALTTLDPETAAALVLVDRDGHSYDEAGHILGIPSGTVASRLHRGRRALRDVLDPAHLDRHGENR